MSLHFFVSNCFYYISKYIGHTFHNYVLSVLRFRNTVGFNKYELYEGPVSNTILFQKDPLLITLEESYSNFDDDLSNRINEVFSGILESFDQKLKSHASPSIRSGLQQTELTEKSTAISNDSSDEGNNSNLSADLQDESKLLRIYLDETFDYMMQSHKISVKLQQKKLLLSSCLHVLETNFENKSLNQNSSSLRYINIIEI